MDNYVSVISPEYMRIIVRLSPRMLLTLLQHSYPERIILNETFAALLDALDHLCVLVLFVATERLLDELFCGYKMENVLNVTNHTTTIRSLRSTLK